MTLFLFGWHLSESYAQSDYIEEHLPLADSLSKVYGIPSSVIMGIAIVETGAGESRNSKLLNNHFGIVGSNNLRQTHGVRTRYKQFSDVRESFDAFCSMVARKYYYARLKGSEDVEKWVEAMASAGYSTKPTVWKKRIMTIISRYDL
ncbi:glucosaminidase domain-containing protein [Olivibacter sitiensis]|uniref:glucosaminidase domain-containing protein n=1 Tax=Olivibacter sitiensis TaxID=376470 RepID=UPI00040C385F|nr:glucosaminidase domain-containing protein [Olivibacter sitiensis]